jgi:caa(3)-type oxidase subunit IV
MADHANHHGAGAAAHHDEKHYIRIWGILCVLLVISIVGPEIGIPIVTLITAFGIAFVKAYLVAKHFMHLDVEKPIVHYALVACLAIMVLFFSAIAPDVMNHDGRRWENVAAKAEVERKMALGAAGAEHGKHGEGAEHAPAAGDQGASAPAEGGAPAGQ